MGKYSPEMEKEEEHLHKGLAALRRSYRSAGFWDGV